jgi:hypothetical protein
MAKEVACEVKEEFLFSSGFWSWCGKKYQTSRPDDGKTPICGACIEAMRKAGKIA